jgi:hypothetical protein
LYLFHDTLNTWLIRTWKTLFYTSYFFCLSLFLSPSFSLCCFSALLRWHMPVILVLRRRRHGGSWPWGQPGQYSKIPSQEIKDWSVAQWWRLANMCKVLGFTPVPQRGEKV